MSTLRLRSAARVLGLMAAGAGVVGCQVRYTADVRNFTDQPVTARLVWQNSHLVDPDVISARIAPGDRATIGPAGVAWGVPVIVSVDFLGNEARPAELRLDGGANYVNVRRADEGSRGAIVLEHLRGPGAVAK